MSNVLATVRIPEASASLTASLAYRRRIPITVACVLTGLSGTLLTAPAVLEQTPLDRQCDVSGWAVLALAVLLRLWSSTHISGRKARALVTTGPYAMCRNPQYVGTLLIAVSQMLFLKSWPFGLAGILPVVLYATGVVPAEERLLCQRFGGEYVSYCQAVPRWLPRWSTLNFRWDRPASWTAFRDECIRCGWWLLLPLASESITWLRQMLWIAG